MKKSHFLPVTFFTALFILSATYAWLGGISPSALMRQALDRVSAQAVATLEISPSSISTPSATGLYSFKAIYDSDGSGPVASQDVTNQSTWVSSNPGYVNPHPIVKGTFVSQNCIGDNQNITVYAFYGSLSKSAVAGSLCASSSNSLGKGNITISARFGVLDSLSGSLTSARDLTQEEKDLVSVKLLKRGDFFPYFYSLVKSGVKLDTATSIDVYSTDLAISQESLPAGWGFARSYSCKPVVGQSTTCRIELFKDQIDHTSDYGVDTTEGPAATLPSFIPSLVQAQLQETILNLSGTYEGIMDMKMIKVSEKQILLVMAKVSGGVSVYSYDATNPENPLLLHENKIGSYLVNYNTSKLVALDDYPYVLISNLARQPNPNYQGVDYWTYTGQIDSSGKLTQVSLIRFAKDYSEQESFNNNSPLALFNIGTKTYLVTTHKAWGPLAFFDVTNGVDLSDSKIISQFSFDDTSLRGVDPVRQGAIDWSNVKVITSGGKTYVVANKTGTGSGWFHAIASDSMIVADISNINSPVVAVAKNISPMFNHEWQLNDMEKKYFNLENPYPSNITLIDGASSKAIHFYSLDEELSTNSANVYQDKDAGEVLPKLRLRDIIAGYTIKGDNVFQEIGGTRMVVCEQRGSSFGRQSDHCGDGIRSESTDPGSGTPTKNPYKSIDLGIPLDMKNGVIISSKGKVALMTSSGILFADTSSAFGGGNLIDAILYQKDSKNFYAFVADSKKVKSVKLTFSQNVQSGGGGGGSVDGGSDTGTTATSVTAPAFSFENLVNIFRRILRQPR